MLYVMAMDGGGLRTLAQASAVYTPVGPRENDSQGYSVTGSPITSLAWSPDGREIAFVGGAQGGTILAVSLSGGGVRTLLETHGDLPQRLSWAPAATLLYGSVLGKSIYQVAADGTGLRSVLKGGWSPSWGPDGTHFAAVVNARIVIVDASGGTQAMIGPPGGVAAVRWGGGASPPRPG